MSLNARGGDGQKIGVDPMPSFDPHSENAEYIEALYQQYLRDPDSLAEEWRFFF